MLELNKIYNMDCVAGMKLLDNECIDLTVTSPPYDNLRTYNGFTWDFESVAKELYRVRDVTYKIDGYGSCRMHEVYYIYVEEV